MKLGCIHGRFQPFHNEHLDYALAALKEVDFLWIGITQYDVIELKTGNSSPSRTEKTANPLTYIERIEIIKSALIENKVDPNKFSFVPFPIEEPNKLKQFVGHNVICYTTVREEWNYKKVQILQDTGYQVVVLWESLDEKLISSSIIREKIINGDDSWRGMVASSTFKFIQQINLKNRLEKILN